MKRILRKVRQVVSKAASLFSSSKINREVAALKKQAGFVPCGHFYSPVIDVPEIMADRTRIFDRNKEVILGVDLNLEAQKDTITKMAAYYDEMPFKRKKSAGLRYYFENPAYSYSDAIFLYSILRENQPRRIIEVGSGFSSCLMLDVNEKFLGNKCEITFIEPYPELLKSLTSGDGITLISKRLQDVPGSVFSALESGDILFIDSTHVSKTGSDVNALFFDLIPNLNSGVLIHIHDIFFPFEYPESWVEEGRSWNEAYLLRAFLQFNDSFEIYLMNTYLQEQIPEFFKERMPMCFENKGGSIWLKRK